MRLRIFAIASLIAALLAAPSSAVAATATFADASDDVAGVPYVDFKRVSVSHSPKRIRLTYRSRSADNMIGTEIAWLDTNPRRPGPELEIGFARFSEGWTIPMRNWKRDRSARAKRSWSTSPLTRGRCDGTVRHRYNSDRGYTPLTITIRKRKGCVATKRARIHLRSATSAYAVDYGPSDTWPEPVVDNFPNGSRTFTGWVRQKKSGAPSTFVDDADPVRWWTDVQSVDVQLTDTTLDVAVEHRPKPERTGRVAVHLDTNGDTIPDWIVDLVDAGGGRYLSTSGPGWDRVAETGCIFTGEVARVGESRSSFSLPTSCIGNPAQVSVAVETLDLLAPLGQRPVDWLTGERVWNGPIAAN